MRVLLDENLPHALKRMLPGHTVGTVQEQGWAGIQNGELLTVAEPLFDVLLTADKNLRYQQNLAGRRIAIVELPTNRLPLLQPLVPRLLETLAAVQPGGYLFIAK
jgi:predicted nuclease of predicted toxin-antitoxin system